MILAVRTTNFKKLGSRNISLLDGSNFITGENGAGKSTVFEAVKFGLYGSTATVGGKELLPTHGCKDCQVTIIFDEFTISRSLSEASVHDRTTGDLLAQGHSPVTKWVEQRLGMDYRAFSMFAMSSQGETQALLTLGAAELNRRVEGYSGVEIIDQIIKQASVDYRVLDERLSYSVRHDVGDLRQQQDAINEQIGANTQQRTELSSKIEQIRSKMSDNTAELNRAAAHNRIIENTERLLPELEGSRDKLRSRQAEAQSHLTQLGIKHLEEPMTSDDLKQIADWVQEANDDLFAAVDIQRQIGEMKRLLPEAKIRADTEVAARGKLATLEDEINNLSASVQQRREALAIIAADLTTATTMLKSGVCPTCERPHDGFDEAEWQGKLTELRTSRAELREADKADDMLLAAAKRKQRELFSAIGNHKAEYEAMVVALEALEAKARDLSPVSVLEANLDRLKEQHRTETHKASMWSQHRRESRYLKKTIEDCNSELTDVLMRIDKLKERAAGKELIDTQPLMDSTAELSEKLEETYSRQSALIVVSRELASKNDELAHTIYQGERANKELDALIAEHRQLDQFIKLLRQKRGQFLSQTWDLILGYASQFLNDTTAGWLTAVGREEKGGFTFSEEGGVMQPIIGCASGAQRAFLGVAIRIGLARAFHGAQTLLMLDEPTESMSEARASDLATGLMAVGGQTVMITHRKDDSVASDNIITIE